MRLVITVFLGFEGEDADDDGVEDAEENDFDLEEEDEKNG